MVDVYRIPSLFELRFVDRAGGCERPHTHPSLIVSAAVGGSVDLKVGETGLQLIKGAVAAVGPGVVHCVRSYSPDFAGVYVLEIMRFPEGEDEYGADCLRRFGHRLWIDDVFYDNFVAFCKYLLSADAEAKKIKRFTSWLHSLMRLRYPDAPAGAAENKGGISETVKNLIERSTAEYPPYRQIERETGFGLAHCNRTFKRVHNLSIQSYFLNRKAALAREMLATGAPLADIAQRCGFYDQSHFTRVFRQIYQISPNAYRLAALRGGRFRTRNRL